VLDGGVRKPNEDRPLSARTEGRVRLLPESPRRRRRLAWSAAAAGVVVVVALAVLLAPSTNGFHSEFHGRPQAIPKPPRLVPMTPARRRQINALLDAFVPSAVARRNTLSSYSLATPALRAGETREQWATGSIPITPYPARGVRFHGWTLNYAYAREVNVSLFLLPRRGLHLGPISFFVDMRRIGDRWRVNSFAPGAEFAAPGERAGVTSMRDLGPGAVAPGDHAPLSAWWVLVPIGIVGLPLAWLIFVVVRSVATGRRRRTPASAYDDYFMAMRGSPDDAGRAPADHPDRAPADSTPGRR